MALTLYLVRHGRTVYNETRRMQGWADSPLTPEGRRGVLATAGALADRSFTAAYCSPSGRTVATAEAILAHHPQLPLTRDDDLREMNFGDWETRPEDEAYAAVNPFELFSQTMAGTHPGMPGSVESARVYLDRVAAAFARIETAHGPDDEVLVVSHGVTLMVYLRTVPGVEHVRLANAAVSVVEVSALGRRSLVGLNLDAAALTGDLRSA